MGDIKSNNQKIYDYLSSQRVKNIGADADEFQQKMQDSSSRRKVYDYLSSKKVKNIGADFDAFSALVYDGGQQPVDNSKWAVTPSPYWNPQEQQKEEAPKQEAQPAEQPKQQAQPAPAPKQQAVTPAPVAEEDANPFPYSGGLEKEAEELRAQLAEAQGDADFVKEYEERKAALDAATKDLRNLKGDIRNTGIDLEKFKADGAWLKENAERYEAAKADKAQVDEINGRLAEIQKEEERRKLEEARKARNERMRGQSENNSIRMGSGGFASYPKDMSMVDVGNSFAADQLDAMSDQELDKGSKFDSGYEGNTLDKVGTAIKQYVEGGINNVDLGSLTAGLSEYTAFKTVRDVAEKNNGLISDAFKKLGYDDEAAGKIISDAEAAWEQLQPAYEELNPMVAELKDMEATLEALANSGDAERYTAAYNKYKKKYDEYAKRLEEYKPLQDTVDKYTELMDAVQEAVASGLSDSERDVLDSFARYIRTKYLSAATESNAAKAGAGFEQSLEFILDFIVTRGLGKTGAKAASKIAANSLLKKTLGETGAKIVGRGLADMGTSAIRTSLMFPRNLAAYGEQITSMDREGSGVDEFGRYTFDRTKANAALNTALSQYIEYWSEGFGEYFGAAEQALFKNATKLAPKTAIGQTLKNYRGSIGKYLDYGKFDGMFNEMLEEVVGSTFNALNGWVSSKIDPNGPGVGDKEALKEFVAGDNLATLFFSFLPMSAIGAATNMKAYHQMKERYDKSVGILNPFIEDGSINREDLEDLTSRTAELSPEQIMDKFKEISRKAAEAQEKKGKVLPKDFDQALAGYLEGSFSMNLQREAWEDSRKIFAVASAYTAQYENPDARSAWDLAQEEQAAKDAALAAGFTEEDLDKDSAILARESAELEETEPERSNILYNYSIAKGQSNGLKDGYDNQTQGVNERNAQFVRSNIDTNGQVIQATLNGNTPVYITQADATVNPDGTVSTPTGDGVVEYVDQAGNKGTAKASAFSGVVSTATGEYIESKSADYAAKRQAAFETMQNTVSPTGQARALNERVGQSVIVTDHNGVYQPFKVERLTNGGSSVVLSGDKKALQGVAEAMGIRVPTSGYLEAPVTSLYPLLAKEEDGSLSTGVGETSQQETAAPAQEAAPAAEQAAGLGDLRDQTVPISVNGQVQNAHVIDMSDGSVMYEELDENGDVVRTSRLSETDFARAMQEAANPTPAAEETMAAEEAPVEEPAAPVIPVDEKTGEKIYDAPGVEVADAIADLYATEGLTEADVDQYIAEEAAKAEAARNPERGNMSPQAWGQAKQEAARVADFWAAMQRAAEQRKAQQEAAIEEAVEEATPVETTEAQPAPESKQRIAPAATPMTVDSRRKVVARLKNWARRTGVKVNIIRSVDEVKDATAKQALKEGRPLTGWFNDKTGQVDVFLPNVMNAVEADKTFIHETVAHKGLRGLLGEEGYDALCDRVWNELMTPEEQEEFMEYNRHLQGSDEYLHRAAADEYIARLSENLDMPDKRNIFERIVDWIMDKLGLGRNVSDIENAAAEQVAAAESITRSDLYDLLEDSLKRFEKGRKKLNTESLPAEIQNEMQAKGLVMDGGAVMDEQQDELKKAAGYKTPNELDMESSPEVGNVRFSESTMPAWARNYMTYRDAKKHVVQVLENFVRDVAADELVHGMVPTGVYKYGEKSSGSFSGPLRTNIEYIVTFDMDTSCPRSLQYLEYVNQIESRIGRPLTQRESVQLIEMMRMYGQMIPCVYCYCENKRQALKQYYTDFMRARNGVINAKTEEEALAAMYGHNDTAEAQESNDPAVVLTPAALEVFKKWREEKDYNPTIEQLWYQYRNDRNVILTVLDNMLGSGAVSTDLSDQKITNALCKDLGITGTEANGAVRDIVSEWKWDRIEDRRHNNFTRIEDEDDLVVDNRTLTLWREMTSYGKSASGAKNVLRYVPYTDELKDLSQEQRDFINGLGGLRMHSSNDFRIDYVLDYFQFMADMAVNHMFGHTYTKSPEFVRIFGNSGYKINMSIAAYEDSRGIRPNADEGFDWTTARELREAFPNAGVMLMATSDAQIQFALDNDWIDMCIPFHHSGLPKAIWYEMRAWSDYSSTQNEKFLNATEMRQALKADGVAVPNKLTAAAVEKMYIDHFNIKILRGKDGKRMRPHFLPGPTPKDGVIIPGHNNDYDTYIRLCREYGVHPRFYGIKVKDNTPEGGGRKVDITEHPGYMKFIKETARTDSPQTAIEFNFDQPTEALGGMSPIEYALSELRARAQAEAERAGGPVRNIYESYKEDPYGIVPQFINGVINHEEEYRKAHNGEELPLDYLTPDSRKWFMTERKALESAYKDFDTIPYHPHEYDENGNLIMTNAEGQPETDAEMVAEEEVANTMFREANRNQLGFVSNADAALDRIKMDKATPEQWVKMLEKEGGLKAGEDKWLGLSDWLKSQDRKSITKDEIADYIDEHRIQIEETHYGDFRQTEQALSDQIEKIVGVPISNGNWLDGHYSFYRNQYGNKELAVSGRYKLVNDVWDALNDKYGRDNFDSDRQFREVLAKEVESKLPQPEVKRINSIREGYTTDGLDNKREIALTVPTVEPWNTSDEIHFGDAGNGRAVAWIRFGDTLAANEGVEEADRKHGEAAKALGEYRERLQEKYADSDKPYYEACTPEELAELNALKAEEKRLYDEWDNLNATPRRVLVIDEIQSKRHQEGREKGYRSIETDRLQKRYDEVNNEHKKFIDELMLKYPHAFLPKYLPDVVTKEEMDKLHGYAEEKKRIRELLERSINNDGGTIPAAPFEKNWHELAMKRMLRLAAEEGYDAVAWTTGGQQAERYNIGGKVDWIQRGNDFGQFPESVFIKMGDKVNSVEVDENGTIVDSTNALGDTVGKPLSDLLGKELAEKVMSATPGKEGRMDGEDLRVGGEGMKGFYDDILPRFMNKYGKKWGVKVSDITLPNVEEAGRVMHAVPVTQEMKESVMQGQTMFREADAAAREEARQSERRDEMTHNWLANTGLRLAKKNIENGVQLSRENPGFTFRLGLPGGSLLAAGVRDQQIVMSEYDLVEDSANGYGDKHSYHPFDLDDLKDFASLINHPIAVFRDPKNPYAQILLLDKKGYNLSKKESGKHNYVAVIKSIPAVDENGYTKKDANGKRVFENRIATVYPADSSWRSLYNQLRDLGQGVSRPGQDVKWVDNKKISFWIKEHASNVRAYDTITQKDIANIQKSFENKQDVLRIDAENLRPSGNTMFRERITPESQKLFDAAKERFGTTRDMREAGYILPDGTMLDFSGRHWTSGGDNSWLNGMRQVDHREISDIGYERDGNTPTGLETDMSDFIRRGAIRINYPGSINLAKKPTWDQADALERLIRMDNSFVRVDFGDGSRTDHYADYDNARPAKVIDDIYGYFDDGVKPSGNTMFREARPVDARNAQAGYEEEINGKVTNFLLEWQDQDIPVRIAINQVMNEVGMENLPEDCDYLTRHNLVSSRADAQMHNYKLFFFEPMMQTIGQIEDILVGGKPSFFDRLTGRKQKRLDAYKKIVDYCYAVSALERNAWKRAEAQRLMEKALERLAEKWEQERAAINADSRLTDEEKAKAVERAEKRYQKESREIEDKYADRDYSGITALMGHSKEEWQEAEDEARAMIADFQRSVNNNELINEMWDRIRACTDFNLEHAYKYGLLSRAEYERLHGTESQPRMWEYYIPLRGFAENTAEDLYNYTMFTSDMAGGDVVKKAKGRVTEADDPFATMRHISEQEIVQGLQNWAKQALYNFVLRAGNNSLLTQVEPWYVKEPGSDNWTVAEPNEGETLEEFETRMQEAYEDGDARRGRNGLKLGRLVGNKMHRNQHMVRLKLNGAEKMIWVNGNPILAQAINGISGWNNKILNGVRTVNRALSQFYTTYSLKFLTKNKLRDTQFSRIAALVDEPQAYLRQLEKNWWANNGIAFGYPMMKLVAEWESGELEKKPNRTEREQLFIDFMYDGGATGYTMINSMDKIKRELERMVKNAGRGERNIPIIDWYAKGVGALNEASELLTRFTFYQTSRMMGRSRERSAYDAKESSVNFNRRGLRSGIGVSGWTSAAASALYLFINPAIQGLDKFVRLHKSHPWRMGLVDATYFMMGFVNSLLNAMIAGASDGDGDDEEKMGPDWYWNIPEWVRRSNMIIGSPFKKLGKWGYLVLALPIEYKGFYAMGELASALVQGKYAAKDAPTIANEVVGVVAELLPVNPVEGYTPGDNPAMSVVRNMMPDIAAPIMDVATNRSFAGIPLWKENIYDEAQPLSQSAFASTPEILNKAVIKLSEVTSDMPWHVDIPSGAVRGLLKGYGGGAYTFVEDMSKLIFADEAHPRRWDNVPFVSGFTGYLEEDRRDSFNSNALQRYKELSDDVVKRVRSAAPGEDLKAADIYNHPESLPQNARVTVLLNSDRYILGQMYYNGMLKAGDDVKKLRSNWNKAKKAYLEIADDKNVSDEAKDAAEKEVQRTWLEYSMSEDSLVDRLMEEEYNHARQKIANGIPYEPKETLGEKAYNLTNRK